MAERQRMSNVDTAWLQSDAPNNLMTIVGLMIFDRPLDLDRFKHTLKTRLLKHERFRQRVDIDPSGAYWVRDPYFDLDFHVLRVSLPGKGGKKELQNYVASLVSQQLDRHRPLWQFQIVEDYEGGGVAIARIHHCIADGISLIGILQGLTDASETPLPGLSIGAVADGLLEKAFLPLSRAMEKTLSVSSELVAGSFELLTQPSLLLDYAKVAGTVAKQAADLALMPDDTPTRLKGKAGAVKRVAWTDPLPLDSVKSLGKILGASVNDVLLSCVSGAIRQYLLVQGDTVKDVEIRAMIPVNLRKEGQEESLGNRFGLVPLLLPIGIEDPIQRVREIRLRMDDLKNSYMAAISMGVLGLAGLTPKKVQRQILDLFAKKATAVMTNVPGPRQPIYLAGSMVKQQMFWVPKSGDIGVGISILSYNGTVQFGAITDLRFVPDPDHLVAEFLPEVDKLAKALLKNPREAKGEPGLVAKGLAFLAERMGLPVPDLLVPAADPAPKPKTGRAPRRQAAPAAAVDKKPGKRPRPAPKDASKAAAKPAPSGRRRAKAPAAAEVPEPPAKAVPAGLRKKVGALKRLK